MVWDRVVREEVAVRHSWVARVSQPDLTFDRKLAGPVSAESWRGFANLGNAIDEQEDLFPEGQAIGPLELFWMV